MVCEAQQGVKELGQQVRPVQENPIALADRTNKPMSSTAQHVRVASYENHSSGIRSSSVKNRQSERKLPNKLPLSSVTQTVNSSNYAGCPQDQYVHQVAQVFKQEFAGVKANPLDRVRDERSGQKASVPSTENGVEGRSKTKMVS